MRFSRVFLYLLFAAYDPTYLVNVLTFVHPDWGMLRRSRHPDWGMLRRSRRVLIKGRFKRSEFLFQNVRISGYVNTESIWSLQT